MTVRLILRNLYCRLFSLSSLPTRPEPWEMRYLPVCAGQPNCGKGRALHVEWLSM